MTSFPTPEICRRCQAEVRPEWIPTVHCLGRPLAGTGEWRSQLVDDRCPSCAEVVRTNIERQQRQLAIRLRLISLGGGEKPYREFSLEGFRVAPGNQLAFARAKAFNAARDNLYLWGACGVGKTHLAFSIARGFCEAGRSAEFLRPPQLMRQVRLKDPSDEQRALDRFIRAEVFVLDDLGIGHETAFVRQIFQEILDGRDSSYRAGLVVTSKYSLTGLAQKLDDDSIPSRLAGLCRIIEIRDDDQRLNGRGIRSPGADGPCLQGPTSDSARND